jgi:hypothetical protein
MSGRRVVHLIRDPQDGLAWEAALGEPAGAEVRVVLVGGGAGAAGDAAGDAATARGITVEELGTSLDYDGLMALIEWSDKVVAW